MNKLMNAFLVFYSFILSILAAILLYGFRDEKVFSSLILLFENVRGSRFTGA